MKEIAPVMFFGYGEDRFLPDPAPESKSTEVDSTPSIVQVSHAKDFRPRRILDEVPVAAPVVEPAVEPAPEVREGDPKGSPVITPAQGSGDDSQTTPSESPADPAQQSVAKEKIESLTPSLL